MSQQNNTIVLNGGKVYTRGAKGGVGLFAFSFERQKTIHVGTVKGQTYEKVAPILRQPEPSFCLSQSEFGVAQECGAKFIRIITPDKSATYSISVEDFEKHKDPYRNSTYGPQWRVRLAHFVSTSKVAARNSIVDNPVMPQAAPVYEKQMSLWG